MQRELILPIATAASPRGWRGMVRALAHVAAQWGERRRTRAALRDLPTHLLRDIGLNEADARAEADKPFWRT
jgi:uncharacterized protein YjiS (DUF1127 family)